VGPNNGRVIIDIDGGESIFVNNPIRNEVSADQKPPHEKQVSRTIKKSIRV
jgi:hypothetical protein